MPPRGDKANSKFNPTESQIRKDHAAKMRAKHPGIRPVTPRAAVGTVGGSDVRTERVGHSRITTVWNGDAIVKRMERAAREAVNETVDAARDDALATHTWENRTGQLEEELISVHARAGAGNPVASFGTTLRRGFYGYFHELGTVHEIARPFLRPAADRTFPGLRARIARRFFKP